MSEKIADHNEVTDCLKLVNPSDHAELLNSVASEVNVAEITSRKVRQIIDQMHKIAAGKHEEGGAQMVGLAAPQVGVAERIIIIDVNAGGIERQAQEMKVLINPRVIDSSSDCVDGREGCWSCDDFCANVPRASWVDIEALDTKGHTIHQKFSGFTARIVQHEVDHLDGIRCIDRVPLEEPWRLHLVHKDNAEEFERYRKEWASWKQTFPRSEWEKFRKGVR
jgi:peptide deformylase